MKEVLNYISNTPIEYFILFDDKFEIINMSNNLNHIKTKNLKPLIWLEDVDRFELFVKNLKREKMDFRKL